MFRYVGVEVITDTAKEEEGAHREENPEGRKECGNLGNNQQEANSVCDQADLTLAASVESLNGNVLDREPGAQKSQCQGRRVGKGIGQQINEFHGIFARKGAKTGGEILHFETSNIGSKGIVDHIGRVAMKPQVRSLRE